MAWVGEVMSSRAGWGGQSSSEVWSRKVRVVLLCGRGMSGAVLGWDRRR